MKTLKKILFLVGSIPILFIAYFLIQEKLFHPFKIEGLQNDFLNESFGSVDIKSRIDFIGIDFHGSLFDYFEYNLDLATYSQSKLEEFLIDYPKFSHPIFTENPQGKQVFAKWTKTPWEKEHMEDIQVILEFGNLNYYSSSQRFIEANYFNAKGNYYSYYTGYPSGYYILLIVPKEEKLFIIRKKG